MPKRNYLLEIKLYLKYYWKPLIEAFFVIAVFAFITIFVVRYNADPPKHVEYRVGKIIKIVANLGTGPDEFSTAPPSFFVFVSVEEQAPIRLSYQSYVMPYAVGDAACVSKFMSENSGRTRYTLAVPEKCGLQHSRQDPF